MPKGPQELRSWHVNMSVLVVIMFNRLSISEQHPERFCFQRYILSKLTDPLTAFPRKSCAAGLLEYP